MDNDMKQNIKKHLNELIHLTTCSAEFLAIFHSKQIFSKSDVQLIETEERNRGQLAASAKFYDLLESRIGSSKILLDALKETNQTGALAVFNCLPKNKNRDRIKVPLRFISKSPQYIIDYLNQQGSHNLIVCSNDCKLTCDWILESTPNCKLYSIPEILNIVSSPLKSLYKCMVFLINLEKNLDLLYSIGISTQLNFVFVTQLQQSEIIDKLPGPTSAWKTVQDIIQWNDLSSKTKFEISSGLKQSLGLDGKQLTKSLNDIDTKSLIDLLNDKIRGPEDLFCETIPSPVSYYVQRTLQTREVITTTVLQNELVNNFVLFSGIERFHLSDLCQQKQIESSGNLLRKKNPISNLVFLENESDFDSISAQFPHLSIHLLEYVNGDFIWKKSRGNMSIIRKHVATKQHTLTEFEFVSRISSQNHSSPVLISDTPGKGKSVLLANLATQVKQHHKTGIVAFIPIKELIQHLKKSKPVSSHKIILSISQFISNSGLTPFYLNANKHFLRELMFDGFDEIDADDTEFAFECFRKISSVLTETRIWITSRPHMLPELENCLETLAYNITPFTKTDQIFFLSSFWSTRIEGCDHKIIFQYAEKCLETLETSLGRTSKDIPGIPLHCLLIGEVYADDANRALKGSSSAILTIWQDITTITDLYKKLIEKKLIKFKSRYNANNLKDSEIFSAHMRMALELLHPSHVSKFSEMLIHTMSRQEILDFGLIESKGILCTWNFLHRTFAEYFIALFVSESVAKISSKMLFEGLIIDIMKTYKTDVILIECDPYYFGGTKLISIGCSQFRQNVTCYFLNNFFQDNKLNLTEYVSSFDFEAISSVAEACIHDNLEILFSSIVANKLKQHPVDKNLTVRAVYWADVHFLNAIAEEHLLLNDNPFVGIVYHPPDFESHIGGNIGMKMCFPKQGLKDYEASFTLLHLAIIKADYATVDFLVTNHFRELVTDNCNYEYKNLIWLLFENSKDSNPWTLTQQKLIVNYLAKLNQDLLVLESNFCYFPLETKKPHLDLVLEVWNLAKKFYSKINVLIQILHTLSREFASENFDKFVKIVFEDLEKGNTVSGKLIGPSYLRENIYTGKGLSTDLLNFLMDQCSKSCHLNSEGRMFIFEEALDLKRDENILEWLLNNLGYTRENVAKLLTYCLENVEASGVNAISVCIKRQKALTHLPNFYEMFDFLFNCQAVAPENNFTLIQLVNFFIMRGSFKYSENADFDTTLNKLIKFGFSYFEKLILKTLVTKSYGCLLKQVWLICTLSKFKKEVFVTKLHFFLKDFDFELRDTCGNSLLHFFAARFSVDEFQTNGKSFLDAIPFSKGFKDKCSKRDDELKGLDIWKYLVKNELNVLQSNIYHQTPLCLLSHKKYPVSEETFSDAILFAANHFKARKNWNIDHIHQLFYLVTKSQSIKIVKKIYIWYTKICKSRKVAVAKVRVSFGGETCNFLDAAIKSGNGDVVEFVKKYLKIHIPLLSPSPTCIHHSIQPDTQNFQNKESSKYIEYLGKIYPKDIEQLVNQSNDRNLVPLSLAAGLIVSSDIVKVLHKFGANINATNQNGNTPLHFALRLFPDTIGVVDQLIKCGSSVNAPNDKMETPISILCQEVDLSGILRSEKLGCFAKCFEMLILNKADPSIEDATGNTSVHYLVQKIISGKVFHMIVEILVFNGFGRVLVRQNHVGLTPLELAHDYFNIHEQTQQFLMQQGIVDMTM